MRREMRRVKFKKGTLTGAGFLHEFTPTKEALIELEDGKMIAVAYHKIRFLDVYDPASGRLYPRHAEKANE